MAALEIHISIQTAQPLTGAAKCEHSGPLRFEGWLELLHVLSLLMEIEPNPSAEPCGCDPSADGWAQAGWPRPNRE